MLSIKPVHPFPARMAAEIALNELASLDHDSLVLDPMAGSGTVLRAASDQGHRGLGFDTDPLAVLMAKVWTTPIDTDELRAEATEMVAKAKATHTEEARLSWLDSDKESLEFVDYWFAEQQQNELRKLSYILAMREGSICNALRVALSRTIITKDRGASLARDVSHSRPHRVQSDNDFDTFEGFLKAVELIIARFDEQPPAGRVAMGFGDARSLPNVETASVDAVITSPPYLNAIDYMRGHRLALVWLGYRIADLRGIRSENIGTERAPGVEVDAGLAKTLVSSLGSLEALPKRVSRMIERYALDMFQLMEEILRVLRPEGKAILVVGNSTLRGVFIENATVVSSAAELKGLTLLERRERDLPPSRRYLPPPVNPQGSHLEKRMRTESVLVFQSPPVRS